MKPVYIAAYHQSKFGKLMGMSVPVSDAPEPQTWFLFAAGAGALLLLGRRRR